MCYNLESKNGDMFYRMKKITTIQKCLMLVLLVVCVGLFYMVVFAESAYSKEPEAAVSENMITISHESGFYAEPFSLTISGDTIFEIYYTLDGTDPSMDNPAAYMYSDEIFIDCIETETVYTIRLVAYFLDGNDSGVINRTFITGDGVEERYDVRVLSVAAPEEFFWGEEEGRFYQHHKFTMKGREYEEEVFMTLFDAEGNVLLSQGCGFQIHGNFSRVKNQIPFRLYARAEYDEQNDFEFALFDNQLSVNNTILPEYDRIVVRNSGNDNGFAFMRSELASRLSLEAGFSDALSASPVAVYLNNTYRGMYWIIPSFDDTYYRETYGDYPGTMYTLEGWIHYITPPEEETDPAKLALIQEYNEVMPYFASCDLTNEENWTALNEYMDVENFLRYLAILNYTSNRDNLNNNFKIYRYVAPEGGTYTPDSVFDGRYRFLLFDLDHCFGYADSNVVWASVDHLTTTLRMTDWGEHCKFLQNLLRREDCQEYYIRYMLSLQNYYFSHDYVVPVMEEMHASRENELRNTYTNTDLLINNDSAPDVTSDEDIERALEDIRNFVRIRKDYVTEDLSTSFGPFTTYEVTLENPEEAIVKLDYAEVKEASFSGTYYKEIPLTITAEAKPGYKFDYWMINGEKCEEASFDVDTSMIVDNALSIECICSPDADAELCITAFKSNAGNDYIELTNLSTEPRYLNNYYLTDNDVWNRSSLPALKLEAGETITIYCNNYTELDALGQPFAGFNLQEGETLSLYRAGEKLLQSVYVPSLGTEEGVYRMDMQTGEFREVR